MKKIIKNGLIGLGIGSGIYLVSGVLFTSGEIRKNSLLVVVLSLLLGALATIYESERLSLLVKSLIQLTLSYGLFLGIAYFGSWFPFDWGIIVTASLLFFSIFAVIWSIYYVVERKKLEQINKALNRR